MIKVGILGATGYAGAELCRILLNHKEVEITKVVSHNFVGQKISDIYSHFKGVFDMVCSELDVDKTADECDVVFCALPHGVSKTVIPALYKKGLVVIDLSGDFRYNDKEVYKLWYGEEHTAPELLNVSVYGLPELHKEEIEDTKLVGNPGCYTTCSILALAPLVKNKLIDNKSIIIDAKSGVTGAGRVSDVAYSFCEATENTKAYKIGTHRHTSEIEQELSLLADEDIMVSFTPHLIPQKRGIYATTYSNLAKDVSKDEIVKLYQEFYKDQPFVRILEDKIPETKSVAGSNIIEIGITVDKRLGRVIVISTIDNLIKGAAGQAVQNMNIIYGFCQCEGLSKIGFYL